MRVVWTFPPSAISKQSEITSDVPPGFQRLTVELRFLGSLRDDLLSD